MSLRALAYQRVDNLKDKIDQLRQIDFSDNSILPKDLVWIQEQLAPLRKEIDEIDGRLSSMIDHRSHYHNEITGE